MAAYAALVSLAQTTDLLLSSGKYSISLDEEASIASIREYVMFLISFLDDFPEKCSRLEGKIRAVAGEIEVLMEDFMWKHNRLSCPSIQRLSRVEFGKQLGKSREEICLLVGEAMDERFVGDSAAAATSSKLADTTENDVAIGLDDDLLAIKDRLCGLSTKLQVIPIVGMGGIGKTTLSRNAYDDALIVGYFHIRAWVTISQDYSANRVLSSLLDSMNLCLEDEVLGEETDKVGMAEKLYKTLKGRRYLVVIDDVWSTNVWDDLRKLFPDDGNGSRIMLTTRLSDVGVYADPFIPLHQMRFMDEEQSWNLLKQKVCCPSELEEMGKKIARSCGGLPLAIVLVGGILSASNMSRASWEKISLNLSSAVNGQLEKILSLSYKHLPQHLRPCFLSIEGCPGDYRTHVSKLIKLWVAEGFLKGENRCKSLEEEAEKYLEDLVKRNLVLVVKRKTNGKIKSCGLHDLVQDLCRRKANEEKFCLHVTEQYAFPEFTHGFHRGSGIDRYLKRKKDPNISCELSRKIAAYQWLGTARSFRLMRVLDMIDDYAYGPLPSIFVELFHLRYLALRHFVEIPSSISNLQNLQTLIVCDCKYEWYSRYNPKNGSYLPFEIWRMPQLRHLVVSYYYMLPDPRDGAILPLENLQTLSGVACLVCSERILKLIPNLKKLGMICFRNEDYCLHNLIHLHHLEKLKVITFRDSSWLRQSPRFPRTLKKLTLYGGQLPWKDMAVVGALPSLEVLKLRFLAYDGDTWETTDGEFLQLKFLLIEELNLQHWITETSHFPRLKSLVLRRCWDLSKIPDGIGELSTLELIEVDDVNKSLVDSAKEIQRDQLENYGNDALQVRCVHFDKAGTSGISPWRFIRASAKFSKHSLTIRPVLGNERNAGSEKTVTWRTYSHPSTGIFAD